MPEDPALAQTDHDSRTAAVVPVTKRAQNRKKRSHRNACTVSERQQYHKSKEKLVIYDCRSPAADMRQLRVKFVNEYYPNSLNPKLKDIAQDFRFAQTILRTAVTECRPKRACAQANALSIAIDAVSIGKMAQATNNVAASMMAAEMHQAALVAYRGDLAKAAFSRKFNSDAVLETAYGLQFCQQFSSICTGPNASIVHVRGLADLIVYRGLQNMASKDEGRKVLEAYLHYALRLGFLLRKPVHMQLAEMWAGLDIAFEGFYAQLGSLAISLPTLLEEVDQLCKSPLLSRSRSLSLDDRAKATSLLVQLQDQEQRLQNLYSTRHPPDQEPPYQAVAISESAQGYYILPASLWDTFPYALRFTSWHATVCHIRFWSCLLHIRSAIAMIIHACSIHATDRGNESVETLRCNQNVTECADELCQTMISMMGNGSGLAGLVGIASHLRSVYRWYKVACDIRKMAWCQAMARLLQAAGISTPDLDER